MSTAPTSPILQQIRRMVEDEQTKRRSDLDLLAAFVEQRDEMAFDALVRRHGPMVLHVCRCVVANEADAEDAFQATFLILARKARSIRKACSLGSWLHGVAYRTSLDARRKLARRCKHELRAPPPDASTDMSWRDVQRVLHEEVSQLAERFRSPVVLCYLEGRTQDEAAKLLGIPKGTLKMRLEQSRAILRTRLIRRGLGQSALLVAAAWPVANAAASVPMSVMVSTVKAASLIAAGQTAAAGIIAPKAAALTEGMLRIMFMSKLKVAAAVVLVLGFMVAGTSVLTGRTAAKGEQAPATGRRVEAPQKQENEKEKEAFTAWGKEVGGVQAGLGFRPGEKRAYSHGETVKLVVRVRNVSKEDVKFQYFKEFFSETPPAVTDGKGKPVIITGFLDTAILYHAVNVSLAPGKEIELYELKLQLRPASESGNRSASTLYGTGKLQVQYKQLPMGKLQIQYEQVGNSLAASTKLVSTLSKATGKLELEVKDAQNLPQKGEQEKEPFTAWGKEVGGLQAGLGFRPGQKRAYHHGETVKLVVRVRNVSKEKVPFQYIYAFLVETPPAITDPDGKAITLLRISAEGLQAPRDVNLLPGKEVELFELHLDLRPASERDDRATRTLYGTGRFQIQYDQVIGKSSGGFEPDPKLYYKLATGKLELEIKSDPPPATEKRPDAKEAEELMGQGTVRQLADQPTLVVETDVKVSMVDRVRKGQEAIVEVDALVGRTFAGKVILIIRLDERAGGGGKAYVEVVDPDKRLANGMTALVLFQNTKKRIENQKRDQQEKLTPGNVDPPTAATGKEESPKAEKKSLRKGEETPPAAKKKSPQEREQTPATEKKSLQKQKPPIPPSPGVDGGVQPTTPLAPDSALPPLADGDGKAGGADALKGNSLRIQYGRVFGTSSPGTGAKATIAKEIQIDLARIDRSIRKEPQYTSKPRYALLVLGPKAETRIWLVIGGRTLYVDRNGNGDLTDPGEAVIAAKTASLEFHAGEIVEADGVTKHTELRVDQYFHVKHGYDVNGLALANVRGAWQTVHAENGMAFARSPKDAPVMHLNGPMTMRVFSVWARYHGGKKVLEYPFELAPGEEIIELHAQVGTPGLGKGTFSTMAVETGGLPDGLHPKGEIAVPSKLDPTKVLKSAFSLDERCCGTHFIGQVDVPLGAIHEKGTVALSFSDWGAGHVTPVKIVLPLRGPPRVESKDDHQIGPIEGNAPKAPVR